jgi:hypothetical protein
MFQALYTITDIYLYAAPVKIIRKRSPKEKKREKKKLYSHRAIIGHTRPGKKNRPGAASRLQVFRLQIIGGPWSMIKDYPGNLQPAIYQGL